MKKLAITFVTILVVTVLASSVFAFRPGWGRGHGMGNYYGKDVTVMSELNLTAEQTTKINVLQEAFLKDIKPLQVKMFSKRGELRLLWLQAKPDQNKITDVQKEVRVLRDQLQDKMTNQRFEVLKVLTPEQQAKVQTFRMGRGFGPGMMGSAGFHSGGPGMGMMRDSW